MCQYKTKCGGNKTIQAEQEERAKEESSLVRDNLKARGDANSSK